MAATRNFPIAILQPVDSSQGLACEQLKDFDGSFAQKCFFLAEEQIRSLSDHNKCSDTCVHMIPMSSSLPPGSTFSCSFELQQYPQLNDGHARILYEAHSYISAEIFQSNSVKVEAKDKQMERLDSILEDLESGFAMTKEGKMLPPYDDDYVGIAHVVGASGNLTVLVRCGRDGFLRAQETSIALPPPAETASASPGSALGGIYSSKFHRMAPEIFARLCKDKDFYSQLNRAVEQYFFTLVTGVPVPLTVGETITNTQKSGKNNPINAKNDFISATKTTKRGRNASRSLRILGHCSPKGFVAPAGCSSVFAVLWFQTDVGIGFVSAEVPQSGEFKYKCSTTMPVPAVSSAGRPAMGAGLEMVCGSNPTGTCSGSSNPTGTCSGSSNASEEKTNISSSPSTVALGNHSQLGVAQNVIALKSRIDNILILLSRMRQDEKFAEAACRLMNCSHIDQLEIMAMNHLMAELGKYP